MKFTKKMLQKIMDNNNGSLYLRGTAITELPDNLTIGDSLDLRGTAITELPDNLTIGGYLNLRGTAITENERKKVKKLKEGYNKENGYIYCDGILTHIKKHKRLFDKYDYFIGKIKNKNVICDGKYYAHCKDIKSGILDLEFKQAKDRGSEQYSNLTVNDTVSLSEARSMYKILTGACSQGTEDFINSLGDKLKDYYTIQEIIDLTNGHYNSDVFRNFFERQE